MFKLLQSFIAVYETRSFSKAAEQLFISQPTISVHIKQLESQLNTIMFERSGRTELVPTTNARRFYQHALHLLDDWKNATDSLELTVERPRTKIRLGASQTSATVLLPKIFTKIKKDVLNNTDFKIEMHNSEEILDGVLNHQFDFGIIEKPITHDFITRDVIAADQLVLAGNLESTVWLIREKGSGVYHYTQQYFKQEHIVPEHFLTIANNDIIVKMLAQNIGKAIVSIQTLPQNIPYKSLTTAFNRHFYLIHHEHNNQPPIKNEIARFIQIARSL
ncbi:LysR family transcriptional regulator [Leuconostoc litchii]|uniref:LysR family transcriptional regulator n=1 Tax=Leuconostoc litchii TaxID=1981069 RepID=A0A6P2CJI7_9LACO|nr:LysR family transcriptional regulator [Leuconostoc litchii]TYC46043.1 LysR family transcriptional regulator [Leuconostoc litchii]GMA69882.1 LysR family transcriptional regulator [Leuconostoc litchii]